jgi:fucose 4-O-acetylase-like acetyltransferase
MSATALTAREVADRTPASRDRYMDFLRAFSILVVVVGHWFIGVIYWREGVIGTTNAIGEVPWMWLGTWFLQVMPLFFFVGGFSNLVSYRSSERRGLSTWAWLRSRLERLLRPSLVFLGVWAAVQLFLHIADIGARTTPFLRGMKPPGATVPFGPLWFLVFYGLLLVAAPVMIRLHRRFGLAVPVAMAAGAIGADALGFVGGVKGARWANAALVWLVPHQLGILYADGRIQRMSRRAVVAMAAGGLAALVLLTNPWIFGDFGQRWFPGIGHYPRSLLGTDVEPISNAYPPTVLLLAVGSWIIGLALLARPRLTRWLQDAARWRGVVTVNGVIMTLFLWHMTAFLLAVLALWPLGLGHDGATSPMWWLERPVWLLVPAAILGGLVAVLARFERPGPTAASGARGAPGLSRSA